MEGLVTLQAAIYTKEYIYIWLVDLTQLNPGDMTQCSFLSSAFKAWDQDLS